ncbi:hypothetical protein [Marixanthomonas spongiae]|uniref:Uncharacterized protein n=1 Tax=Marixanthomonas spongiae TaxID=2174845 RepID=A0A2U0I5B6_9FLAO|nr:hypothetical protein [Marixanthomonas spongiae]PVW16200.1 hypothetical protein DDV96_02705 [Marixanthomonas spongiae]
MSKKELTLNKSIVKNILLSLLCSLIFFFILEHFGSFTYQFFGGQQPYKTPVTGITYETLFGNKVQTDGQGYTLSDTSYKGGEFDSYLKRLPYYIKAIYADIMYVAILAIIIFSILFIRRNYSIKIS